MSLELLNADTLRENFISKIGLGRVRRVFEVTFFKDGICVLPPGRESVDKARLGS